jgi:fatty acid desaturase
VNSNTRVTWAGEQPRLTLLTHLIRPLPERRRDQGGVKMFLIVAVVLMVLWVMGAFVFRVMSGLVHIVLVLALIALAIHFLRGHP